MRSRSTRCWGGRRSGSGADLEEESGEALLRMTGGLDIGTPDAYEMAGIEQTYQTLGMPYERLDRAGPAARYPQLNLPEGTIGLRSGGLRHSGRHPLRADHGGARQGRQRGGRCRNRVRAVEPDGKGVTVRTDNGEYRAARVDSHNRLVDAAPARLAWASISRSPCCRSNSPSSRRAIPRRTGRTGCRRLFTAPPNTTSLGSFFPIFGPRGGEDDGRPHRADRSSPDNPDRTIDPVAPGAIARLRTDLLPSATGEILETTSCRFTMTPDANFVIDLHPEHPQVVIASTCSGHGFKSAPAHRPDVGRPGPRPARPTIRKRHASASTARRCGRPSPSGGVDGVLGC